jgi:hypothetical protein
MTLMKAKRKQPSKGEMLAACLMQLVDGAGKPMVDREAIRAIPDIKDAVRAVLAQFQCDHGVFVAIGGDNHPCNLTMRLTAEHAAKTKKDVKAIAKTKRLHRKLDARMTHIAAPALARIEPRPLQWSKSPPMPGTRASRFKKPFNKPAIRRET